MNRRSRGKGEDLRRQCMTGLSDLAVTVGLEDEQAAINDRLSVCRAFRRISFSIDRVSTRRYCILRLLRQRSDRRT